MRNCISGIIGVLLLLAGRGAIGQDSGEADRLRQEIRTLRQETMRRLDERENRLQVHGFVSQGYMRSTMYNYLAQSDNGSFEFSEVGLNFRSQLTDSVSVGAQIVGRDLGELGNHDLVIDWAYGDYNLAEWLGVRIGRVKMPVGQYNEARDVDSTRISVLLPTGTYSELFRDFILACNGVQFYGTVQLGPLGSFSYQTWLGGMSIDENDSGIVLFIEDRESNRVDIQDVDIEYVAGAFVEWSTPLDGLRLTGTWFSIRDLDFYSLSTPLFPLGPGIPISTNVPWWNLTTAGFEYSLGNLVIASEFMYQHGESYSSVFGVPQPRSTDHLDGFYLMTTYQLTDQLAFGATYSEYYNDTDDRDGRGREARGGIAHTKWQKDLAVFGRYDLTDRWTLKAEMHFIRGTGQLLAVENQDDLGNDLRLEEDWKMILLKASYNF